MMFPSLNAFWIADHRPKNRLRRTSNDVVPTDYNNPRQLPTESTIFGEACGHRARQAG
jgi:hypothetical protein